MDGFGLPYSSVGLFVVNTDVPLFDKGLVIIQGFMKFSSFYYNIYKADFMIAIDANKHLNIFTAAMSIVY